MPLPHHALESCKEWLPKPRRKHRQVIVQCAKCKKFYVGDWDYGYVWSSVEFPKKEK